MTTFPREAHQQSLQLALDARRAFARGREVAATDRDLADEHYMEAFDLAREAGHVCGAHDLPAPFALTQLKHLMVAFADGEADGAAEREGEMEIEETFERLAA